MYFNKIHKKERKKLTKKKKLLNKNIKSAEKIYSKRSI